jgi:rubrerythrin
MTKLLVIGRVSTEEQTGVPQDIALQQYVSKLGKYKSIFMEISGFQTEKVIRFHSQILKELKEMIKASIMNEMHCSKEVREQEEEEVEVETEEEVEIEAPTRELSAEEEIVQDSLEKALEAAKKLDNEKLVTQIANTITYFTRSEVIKENQKTEVDIKDRFLRTLRMS